MAGNNQSGIFRRSLSQAGAAVLLLCLLAGCQTQNASLPYGSNLVQATRNNCYSLLYQLLGQQEDVSFLRFIKHEHADVKHLTERIATASRGGERMLAEFAKQDHSVILYAIWLPPGEVKTRDAIAATDRHALLTETGQDLDLTLLFTQLQALNYASHLAGVIVQSDPNPERARKVAALGQNMTDLYQEAYVLLLAKMNAPANKS
jgi:hypothetical protein